jgi:hypothetical protein
MASILDLASVEPATSIDKEIKVAPRGVSVETLFWVTMHSVVNSDIVSECGPSIVYFERP